MNEISSARELLLQPAERIQSSDNNIPEFFAFAHKSTKWIITLLSSPDGLKRLSFMGKQNCRLFTTYFQIPDKPSLFFKTTGSFETSAYYVNGVLYLTPLGLAIYMKRTEAIKTLLKMKDSSDRRIIHPNEICFVQQDPDKPTNDLQSTYPALIAVRRNYYEGVVLLMKGGYCPQKDFGIIWRKGESENLSIYKDLIDYILDMLKQKPGQNIATLIQFITKPSLHNFYDVYTYDAEKQQNGTDEWISIFRRVAQLGVKNNNVSGRNGIALMAALETIQKLGFLRGLIVEQTNYLSSPLPIRNIGSAMSEMVRNNVESQVNVRKIYREDMLKEPNAFNLVSKDRDACIGTLVAWYQLLLKNGRTTQKEKLELLLARCLLDTGGISIFFNGSNEETLNILNIWIDSSFFEIETIRQLRLSLLNTFTFVPNLNAAFIKRYQHEPKQLIKKQTKKLHNSLDLQSSNCPDIETLAQVEKSILSNEVCATENDMFLKNSIEYFEDGNGDVKDKNICVEVMRGEEYGENVNCTENRRMPQKFIKQTSPLPRRSRSRNQSQGHTKNRQCNEKKLYDKLSTDVKSKTIKFKQSTANIKSILCKKSPENNPYLMTPSVPLGYSYNNEHRTRLEKCNHPSNEEGEKSKHISRHTHPPSKHQRRYSEHRRSRSRCPPSSPDISNEEYDPNSEMTVEVIKTRVNKYTNKRHQTVYRPAKINSPNKSHSRRAKYYDSTPNITDGDEEEASVYTDARRKKGGKPHRKSRQQQEGVSKVHSKKTLREGNNCHRFIVKPRIPKVPEKHASRQAYYTQLVNGKSKTKTLASGYFEGENNDEPTDYFDASSSENGSKTVTVKQGLQEDRESPSGTQVVQSTMSALMKQFALNMTIGGVKGLR